MNPVELGCKEEDRNINKDGRLFQFLKDILGKYIGSRGRIQLEYSPLGYLERRTKLGDKAHLSVQNQKQELTTDDGEPRAVICCNVESRAIEECEVISCFSDYNS